MTSILKGPATHTSSFNIQANETAKGIKRSIFNSKLQNKQRSGTAVPNQSIRQRLPVANTSSSPIMLRPNEAYEVNQNKSISQKDIVIKQNTHAFEKAKESKIQNNQYADIENRIKQVAEDNLINIRGKGLVNVQDQKQAEIGTEVANQMKPRNLVNLEPIGNTLHAPIRNREISRILHENELMLKRLQNSQSTYNVYGWEQDRKQQVRMIKQICMYPLSVSKKRRHCKKRQHNPIDIEKRYATSGPNKQMYDMYRNSLNQNFQLPQQDNKMENEFDQQDEKTIQNNKFSANSSKRQDDLDLINFQKPQQQSIQNKDQNINTKDSFSAEKKKQQIPNEPKNDHIPAQKNQINIVAKKRPPAMQIKNFMVTGIDPKRKVLYRNFHDIDGTIYLVEISRNALKVFVILFPNFEMPDIYLCQILHEKVAQKLMADSDNMFEQFVKSFRVKWGKLQIEGLAGKYSDARIKIRSVPPVRSRAGQLAEEEKAIDKMEELEKKFGYQANNDQHELDNNDEEQNEDYQQNDELNELNSDQQHVFSEDQQNILSDDKQNLEQKEEYKMDSNEYSHEEEENDKFSINQ